MKVGLVRMSSKMLNSSWTFLQQNMWKIYMSTNEVKIKVKWREAPSCISILEVYSALPCQSLALPGYTKPVCLSYCSYDKDSGIIYSPANKKTKSTMHCQIACDKMCFIIFRDTM